MSFHLFSIFDPAGLIFLFPGWLIIISLFLFLLSSNKFYSSFSWSISLKMFPSALKSELDTPLGPGIHSHKTKSLLSIALFIMLLNLFGLIPYIFTPTAHMIIPLLMAVPLWLALYTFSWVKKTDQSFAHLVPMGTPGILMPFMVIIESISAIIRPLTLSIRLMANMVAGHLLLSLSGGAITSILSFIPLFSAQLILTLLELAVACIQGYVFMILMALYLKEVFILMWQNMMQ